MLLVELGELEDVWKRGKELIQQNSSTDHIQIRQESEVYGFDSQSKKSRFLKYEYYPDPNELVATVCQQGSQRAVEMFEERKAVIQRLAPDSIKQLLSHRLTPAELDVRRV